MDKRSPTPSTDAPVVCVISSIVPPCDPWQILTKAPPSCFPSNPMAIIFVKTTSFFFLSFSFSLSPSLLSLFSSSSLLWFSSCLFSANHFQIDFHLTWQIYLSDYFFCRPVTAWRFFAPTTPDDTVHTDIRNAFFLLLFICLPFIFFLSFFLSFFSHFINANLLKCLLYHIYIYIYIYVYEGCSEINASYLFPQKLQQIQGEQKYCGIE